MDKDQKDERLIRYFNVTLFTRWILARIRVAEDKKGTSRMIAQLGSLKDSWQACLKQNDYAGVLAYFQKLSGEIREADLEFCLDQEIINLLKERRCHDQQRHGGIEKIPQ